MNGPGGKGVVVIGVEEHNNQPLAKEWRSLPWKQT